MGFENLRWAASVSWQLGANNGQVIQSVLGTIENGLNTQTRQAVLAALPDYAGLDTGGGTSASLSLIGTGRQFLQTFGDDPNLDYTRNWFKGSFSQNVAGVTRCWFPATQYAVGDLLGYNGAIWICTIAGLSGDSLPFPQVPTTGAQAQDNTVTWTLYPQAVSALAPTAPVPVSALPVPVSTPTPGQLAAYQSAAPGWFYGGTVPGLLLALQNSGFYDFDADGNLVLPRVYTNVDWINNNTSGNANVNFTGAVAAPIALTVDILVGGTAGFSGKCSVTTQSSPALWTADTDYPTGSFVADAASFVYFANVGGQSGGTTPFPVTPPGDSTWPPTAGQSYSDNQGLAAWTTTTYSADQQVVVTAAPGLLTGPALGRYLCSYSGGASALPAPSGAILGPFGTGSPLDGTCVWQNSGLLDAVSYQASWATVPPTLGTLVLVGANTWICASISGATAGPTPPMAMEAAAPTPGTIVDDGGVAWVIVTQWRTGTAYSGAEWVSSNDALYHLTTAGVSATLPVIQDGGSTQWTLVSTPVWTYATFEPIPAGVVPIASTWGLNFGTGSFTTSHTASIVVTPAPPDTRTDAWARMWLVIPSRQVLGGQKKWGPTKWLASATQMFVLNQIVASTITGGLASGNLWKCTTAGIGNTGTFPTGPTTGDLWPVSPTGGQAQFTFTGLAVPGSMYDGFWGRPPYGSVFVPQWGATGANSAQSVYSLLYAILYGSSGNNGSGGSGWASGGIRVIGAWMAPGSNTVIDQVTDGTLPTGGWSEVTGVTIDGETVPFFRINSEL